MNDMLRSMATIPGWLLDHPVAIAIGVIAVAVTYVIAFRVLLDRQVRREERDRRRRWGA